MTDSQFDKPLSQELKEQTGLLEKNFKETLIEDEELHKILMINSPIGIYVVQNGRFKFVNQKFKEYSGFSEEELLGREALSLIHPEDRERVRQNAILMLKGKTSALRTAPRTILSKSSLKNLKFLSEKSNQQEERLPLMYAVIMAGGKGTRFWPRSRESKPKHLLDIISEKTIIQETVDRIRPLVPVENILIVTGRSHADELMRQLPEIPRENIIVEPVGRNTAPCIGLAALHIKKKAGEDVMVVLPSDHLIADEERFLHTLVVAAKMAQQGDYLLTIGIKPTGPETGYGYIEQGDLKATIGGEDIYEVRSVREKPSFELAKTFLEDGGFFWNSGMFIWKVSTILEAIKQWLPDLYRGLLHIESAVGTDREGDITEQVYREIVPISIDYGVMEKANDVLLLKGEFRWNDLGSWDALWEIADKDERGNVIWRRENFIGVDTRNSLIYSPQKLVVLVGVEDLLVIETEDSLLICKRGSSQNVKTVVKTIEAKNMREYL
ncbi:MAG: sugar phosphate nucleotidyltransferase [Syntrophales bacterium]|nr:sugar phosphate nucleotidyltransferase [Syntrophales bacterium]